MPPPPAPVLRESDSGIGAGRPRSWPAPPGSRPTGGALGARPTAHSSGDTGDHRLNDNGTNGRDHAPAPHEPPAQPQPDATASGLARRVRGAQLPTTQPLNLRRSQEPPSGGTAGYRLGDNDDVNGHMLGNATTGGYTTGGYTNGQANGSTNGYTANGHANGHADGGNEESSAARSVYGFLTSFTQGVQRGLEEVQRDPNTPKENS